VTSSTPVRIGKKNYLKGWLQERRRMDYSTHE